MWGSCFDSVSRLLRPRPSITHNFVTHHLSHTQLCHTHHLSHTNLSHTISSDNFVTQHLSHPTLSDTTMSHHLSHTTLSHTHTPSFTPNFVRHNFVTHHLSHTTLSWQAWLLRQWAGSGGALWRAWSPVTPGYFAWQVWHLATWTCILRGRRGTWRHPPSLCVAGVALGGIHLHFAVGLGDIYLESTLTLRGRRGTFLKLCWHVYVLEAMLACFRMFRFGPTWEEAVCMFDKNVLEAMLACFFKKLHTLHTCFVLSRPGTILILHGRRARGCRTGVAFI